MAYVNGKIDSSGDEKKISELLSKKLRETKNNEILFCNVKGSDELIQALYGSHCFQGGKTYIRLLELLMTIELRQKNRTESLDALLLTPRK
jgi:hypothetical protein